MEGIEKLSNKSHYASESAMQIEPSQTTKEMDEAVLHRTPLKVSLKRVGKREHEALDSPLKCSTDDLARENEEVGKATGDPPPRKLSARHSPSLSRATQMSNNLRSSLRGSTGSSGLKQVKKLVVKSSLGTITRKEIPPKHFFFPLTSLALADLVFLPFLISTNQRLLKYPTTLEMKPGQSSKRP